MYKVYNLDFIQEIMHFLIFLFLIYSIIGIICIIMNFICKTPNQIFTNMILLTMGLKILWLFNFLGIFHTIITLSIVYKLFQFKNKNKNCEYGIAFQTLGMSLILGYMGIILSNYD